MNRKPDASDHSVPDLRNIPSVSIYGIPFCKLGMQETVQLMTDMIRSGKPHQVITANPIMVMAALGDPAYKAMMQRAELIVPDGTGIVWAAKYAGNPVKERVPGIELLHELLRVGESFGWRFYLLGAAPDIVAETARRLQQRFPGIAIAGYRDGFFGPQEDAEVIRSIREAKPDVLFVARGADTQEPWIDRYKHELGVPLVMGVGGSFDVIAGKTKRAPRWVQRMRLEWLYRLIQEPFRYKRMLVLPKFVLYVLRDKEKLAK
jgi:N-acetylglucosaminyldiphosphoundecaprenol N-acetyl-beta-D-mannosaminyltransferase